MALVQAVLKEQLRLMLTEFQTQNLDNPEDAIERLADRLASIITDYVKSASVVPGIAVQVDPNTGTGSTLGVGNVE